MKDLTEHKKIAVLIDSDNAQHTKIKLILDEISAHGHIVVKRAYGDWSSDYLKNWKTSLNELAIQPIQQFAYTTGKNSTDASMIIDAMDLLYSDKFDAFAIVSSDSDFTKIVSRLRESEKFVFGVGQKKTPISFRNACDDFIYVENLEEEPAKEKSKTKTTKKADKDQTKNTNALNNELISLLDKGLKQFQDEEGWANTAQVGAFIKRSKPDFDPRTYNATKLSDVIGQFKKLYEMKKLSDSVAYRRKKKAKKKTDS